MRVDLLSFPDSANPTGTSVRAHARRRLSALPLLAALAVIPALSACGGAPPQDENHVSANASAGDESSVQFATEAAVAAPTLINSDPTLDQRFLPGIGYFDGTTCDTWPRDIAFSAGDDLMGAVASVLSRYSIPSSVKRLRALTDRLRDLHVRGATVFGSKNELVVTNAVLSANDKPLVAVDYATRQGYMIGDEWLCTQAAYTRNPLLCREYTVKVGKTAFSVLGKTTKASYTPENLNFGKNVPYPQTLVVLTAPQIRFAPSVKNGDIVSNTFLIAAGQRVYGGSTAYRAGEDLSQRTSDIANVYSRPDIAQLSATPSQTEWIHGLYETRHPGLLAIFGEEVGGFGNLVASARAAVEHLVVGYDYDDDSHFEPATRTLYLHPDTFLRQTISDCDPVRVQGTLGTIACDYSMTMLLPRLRGAGGGGASFLIAGTTPNTANVNTEDDTTRISLDFSLANVRRYLKQQAKAKLDAGTNTFGFYAGGKLIDYINGQAWLYTSGYASSALDTLQSEVFDTVNAVFTASPDVAFTNYATADAGTDTGVRQADMGAELFTHGAFSDVLFARSELDSLRTGVISPTWADAARLVSDYNLGARRIPGFDAQADMGIDPVKRDRMLALDTYLQLAAGQESPRNVLGLSYGQTASSWYALRDQGSVSLYAAERRWNQLGSLVDNFQTAASNSDKLADVAQRDALIKIVTNLKNSLATNIQATASAAGAVATAAKANAATQQVSLDEFNKGFQSLVDINASLQRQMGTIWGCDPGATPDQCIATAQGKLNQLQNDCAPSNGLSWLKPVVGILTQYIPGLKSVDDGLKEYTNKGLVDNVDALIENPNSWQSISETAIENYVASTDLAKSLKDIDKITTFSAQWSRAIRGMIDESSPTCERKSAQSAYDSFRAEMTLVSDLSQSLATQM